MLEKAKIKEFIEDWLLSLENPDMDAALPMLEKLDTAEFSEVLKYFINMGCKDLGKFFEKDELRKAQLQRVNKYCELLSVTKGTLGEKINFPVRDSIYYGIMKDRAGGKVQHALYNLFMDDLFSYDSDLELEILGVTPITPKEHIKISSESNTTTFSKEKKAVLMVPGITEYYNELEELVKNSGVSKAEIIRAAGITNMHFASPSKRDTALFPIQQLYNFSGSEVFKKHPEIVLVEGAGKMMKAIIEKRIIPPPSGKLCDPLDEDTWILAEQSTTVLVGKKLQEYTTLFTPKFLTQELKVDIGSLRTYAQGQYCKKYKVEVLQKFYDLTGDKTFLLVAGVIDTPHAGKDFDSHVAKAKAFTAKEKVSPKAPPKPLETVVKVVPLVEATPVVETGDMIVYEKLKAHGKHPEAIELYNARKEVISKQRDRIVPKQSLKDFAVKAKIDEGELQVAYMTPIFNSQEMNRKLEKATGHTIFSIEEDRKLLTSIEGKVEKILETITPEASSPLEVEEEVYEVAISERGEENAPPLDVPVEPMEQTNEESIPPPEITEIVESEETPPQESEVLSVEKSESVPQVCEEPIPQKIVLSEREKVEAHICFLERELALVEDKMKETSSLRKDLLETVERLGSKVSQIFKKQMDEEIHRMDQEMHAMEEVFHKYTFQKEYAQNERALHHALEDAKLQIQKLQEEVDLLRKTGGGVKEFVEIANIAEIPKEYLSMYDFQSMQKVLERKSATKADLKKMAKAVKDLINAGDKILYQMLPYLGSDKEMRMECFNIMNTVSQNYYKNWNQFTIIGGPDDIINQDIAAQKKIHGV